MELKAVLVSIVALLVSASSLPLYSLFVNEPVHVEELGAVREELCVVASDASGETYVVKYFVYRLGPLGRGPLDAKLKISQALSSSLVNELGVSDVVIEVGTSKSAPISLPKLVLSYEEYRELISSRYKLERVGIDAYSEAARMKLREHGEYLLVLARLLVNGSKRVDLLRHVPPIVYYPREVALNATLSEVVRRAASDVFHLSALKYSLDRLLSEHYSVKVFAEHYLSAGKINYRLLAASWILVYALNEYRRPGTTVNCARKLFYKLRALLGHMLKLVAALRRYIEELSRA